MSGHRTRQAEKEDGGERIRLRLPFPRMQVHVNINPITTFLSVLTPSLRSIKVCAVLARPPLPFSADADNDIGEMLISTFGLVASCKRRKILVRTHNDFPPQKMMLEHQWAFGIDIRYFFPPLEISGEMWGDDDAILGKKTLLWLSMR